VSCSRSNCLAPSMQGEPTQADVASPQPPSGDYDAPACLAFSWRASCRVVHAGRPSNKTETPKMGPLRRPECHFLRSAGHADLLVPAMTGPGGLATRTHLEMAACGCARGNLGTNCDRVAEPYEPDESGAYTMRPRTFASPVASLVAKKTLAISSR